MVSTLPRQSKIEIVCPFCGKLKDKWNRHHFGKVWKRTCVDCHNNINYYIAPCEEKSFTWNDIDKVKRLIKRRKTKYG